MSSLIIEAAGSHCLLQLEHHDQLFFSSTGDDGRHDQRLLPAIESLLAEHQVTWKEIDWIGVGIGPGSFTGIRVGVSLAQGLSLGLGCGLKPLDSLALIALGAGDGRWHIATDARLGETYTAAYEVNNHAVTTVTAPSLGVYPQTQSRDGFQPLGDGWETPVSLPQVNAAVLGWHELALQTAGVEPEELMPAYLREQVNWKKVSEQPRPLSKG